MTVFVHEIKSHSVKTNLLRSAAHRKFCVLAMKNSRNGAWWWNLDYVCEGGHRYSTTSPHSVTISNPYSLSTFHIRICMDPRYLNQYLERAIFPFPSLYEVFSIFIHKRGKELFKDISRDPQGYFIAIRSCKTRLIE
jgi:hypothetical protein